jgi:hypothetical protein
VADRNPSFFGPVLPQRPDAPEAFTAQELTAIRARRMEADLLRAGSSAWPERRRFETMLPAAARHLSLVPPRGDGESQRDLSS